jgi:hypothetical protein
VQRMRFDLIVPLTVIAFINPRPALSQDSAQVVGVETEFPWRDSVRYGGGPSFGAPDSDFDGTNPPKAWCLTAGDWGTASRGWLKRVLSDTTDWGDGWRDALRGAPRLAATDSVVAVQAESQCHRAAQIVNRAFLGWPTAPPVMLLEANGHFIVLPSSVRLGEFGLAVHIDPDWILRGVATW